MKAERTTPGLGGARALIKNAAVVDGDVTNDTADAGLRTTCRHSLVGLTQARRRYRAISPELSDALDMATESLRTALTIMELEGRNND